MGQEEGDMSTAREEAPLTPRQRTILEELGRRGFISTTDLAETFAVSDMTVRRDTRVLSKLGLVRVVHGGVSAIHGQGQNADFAARVREDSDAKLRVARACVSMIGERDAIILDAGTTTYQIAQELPSSFTGTIITHSAPAIQRCLQHRVERSQGVRRRCAGGIGAGGYQRPAEGEAQRDDGRMRADPHGHAVVGAGDPVRHAAGGRHDPGIGPGPTGEHALAPIHGQCVPVEQPFELVERPGDEDQALVDRALLERQQMRDSRFVERIAAQAPHGFGRIGDDAAAPEQRSGIVDGQCGRHGARIAWPALSTGCRHGLRCGPLARGVLQHVWGAGKARRP